MDASDVARLPQPGLAVPKEFAFTPDGQAVTYLKSESTDLSQVLWRAGVSGGKPRVVARPPESGNTEANLSEVDKLRRERQRLLETGIAIPGSPPPVSPPDRIHAGSRYNSALWWMVEVRPAYANPKKARKEKYG